MLKEVFVPIEEDEREKIKGLLKEAGNQDMLNKILQVETRMAVSKGFDSIYVVPPTASAAIVTAATAIIMGINSTATIPGCKKCHCYSSTECCSYTAGKNSFCSC